MVLQSKVEIPNDGIRLQVPNTHLYIENNDYGKGTLCVAERLELAFKKKRIKFAFIYLKFFLVI